MKTITIIGLVVALSFTLLGISPPAAPFNPGHVQPSLDAVVEQSYSQVLVLARQLKVSEAQIKEFKRKLEAEKEEEKARLKIEEQSLYAWYTKLSIGNTRPISTASGSERLFRQQPVAGAALATARGTDGLIRILV
jgi:hypothetical protein